MMLYAMDEMFQIFQGMGTNDLDGYCIVAYEIFTIVSLHCMEWHGSTKKCQKTFGDAYPMVNLNNENGLECLA